MYMDGRSISDIET